MNSLFTRNQNVRCISGYDKMMHIFVIFTAFCLLSPKKRVIFTSQFWSSNAPGFLHTHTQCSVFVLMRLLAGFYVTKSCSCRCAESNPQPLAWRFVRLHLSQYSIQKSTLNQWQSIQKRFFRRFKTTPPRELSGWSICRSHVLSASGAFKAYPLSPSKPFISDKWCGNNDA